jgi:hypothetical protein
MLLKLSAKQALKYSLAAALSSAVAIIAALLLLIGCVSSVLARALRNCDLNVAAAANSRSSVACNTLVIALPGDRQLGS